MTERVKFVVYALAGIGMWLMIDSTLGRIQAVIQDWHAASVAAATPPVPPGDPA
jgi:ABC-type polysaccharide/polyol phosphate export permease